jgi:hypothetical protein
MGEHRRGRRLAGHPDRLVEHPPQHRRDQLSHWIFIGTEQQRAIVDPPLDVRLVPAGVQPRTALSVSSGEQPAARLGVDR